MARCDNARVCYLKPISVCMLLSVTEKVWDLSSSVISGLRLCLLNFNTCAATHKHLKNDQTQKLITKQDHCVIFSETNYSHESVESTTSHCVCRICACRAWWTPRLTEDKWMQVILNWNLFWISAEFDLMNHFGYKKIELNRTKKVGGELPVYSLYCC